MNNKKAGRFSDLLKIVEGKGFYIILSLCVIAIGVSGYVLFFTNTIDSEDFDLGEIDSGTVFWPDDESYTDEPVISQPDDEPADTDQPVINTPDDEPDQDTETTVSGGSDTPAAATAKAAAPTAGDIIKPFSGDRLVYDQTMCDWRTHNGTDFSCTQGDTVFCIRDGKVLDVSADGLMGYTVTVEHADGIVSQYMGLSSVQVVKKGDTLKMGDAVGTAGGTAIAESSQPYHIHVSVTQYGKYIDVMNLF